jgi:glycosyltransferase involved in cell wall biosynthesis
MFEGFGLPVLEAMGHGCPVIAANTTALPEVVGECGILVDPEDPHAWAGAMLDVLENESTRLWLAEAGISRTTEFRWSASAEQLHAVYRRIARELAAS